MGDQGEDLRCEATHTKNTEEVRGVKKSRKVAVIGGGAAGLVAARELLREGHQVSVYEQRNMVGGVWLYDPEIETDLLGIRVDRKRVHSSMYASLRTNIPRELMGFLDYPFLPNEKENEKETEKEGSQIDTRRYPGHLEVASYLQDFAEHFGLMECIHLSTVVEYVGVCETGESNEISWKVRTRQVGEKTTENSMKEENFDAVVVCNGHYFEPYVAPIPGMSEWPGRQMHSHNYREPNSFADQIVVVIGNGISGKDISMDIAKFAKEVHMSGRKWSKSSNVDFFKQPCGPRANIWHRSMVEYVCQDGTVKFEDGGSMQPDVILHCTGYLYSFPFLDSNGKVSVEENCVGPLYEHVFAPALSPTLSFVGLPNKVTPFILCELQSRWIAMALSGRVELPSLVEMQQSVEASYAKLEASGMSKRSIHNMLAFQLQFEHFDWLCDQTGRDYVESWRKELFEAILKNRHGINDYNLDVIDEKEQYEEAMISLKKMEIPKR